MQHRFSWILENTSILHLLFICNTLAASTYAFVTYKLALKLESPVSNRSKTGMVPLFFNLYFYVSRQDAFLCNKIRKISGYTVLSYLKSKFYFNLIVLYYIDCMMFYMLLYYCTVFCIDVFCS